MAGELINYSNYKSLVRDGSAWTYEVQIQDENKTYVVCAPSFRCVCEVSSVFLRDNWIQLVASYWNGTGWTQTYSNRLEKSGANSGSFSFNHNREQESSDDEDRPTYNLWKLDVSMKGANGSAHSRFKLWCGGIEMMTQNEYNETCIDRKIQCCKPDYWGMGGTYATAEQCVAAQRPSVFRGTPLTSETYRFMSASDIDNEVN